MKSYLQIEQVDLVCGDARTLYRLLGGHDRGGAGREILPLDHHFGAVRPVAIESHLGVEVRDRTRDRLDASHRIGARQPGRPATDRARARKVVIDLAAHRRGFAQHGSVTRR